MQTIAFKTLGCKVNQYETELIREQFISAGFNEVLFNNPADIYVINTCTVTQKADSESRRLIRNARAQNPNSKIIVTGCYTDLDSDEIRKIDPNLLIVKNSKKTQILQYLSLDHQNHLRGGLNHFVGGIGLNISRFEGRTKAFVKVQDGCNNFCSYCKVPFVRGRSRSRKPDEIIKEIQGLVLNGYKEIILCGICLGDWGKNLGLKLVNLLDEIDKNIDGIFRIRLSSIEPWYVTMDLLEKIASSKRFCRHLHMPMQSGDDEILKKMNRKFKSQDFMNLIDRIRLLIPEIAFTTDIMVGFPGEREEQFDNTLRAVEFTRPSRVHIFPFSVRKGTKAALFKEIIPDSVVKKRINKLKSLTDKFAIEYKRQFIGKPQEVLVETQRDRKTGKLTGYTDAYIKVNFEGPDELKGKFTLLTLSRQLSLFNGRGLTNLNSYDILAARLEGVDTEVGRLFPEDKLDRFIRCNSFSQK